MSGLPVRALAAALLLGIAGGCGAWKQIVDPTPPPVSIANAFRAPTADGHPVRRVAVLPFQDLTGHETDAAAIRQSLLDAFQKRQPFEVVAIERGTLGDPGEAAFFRSGMVAKETLMRIAERYHADAVVYGALTRYRPFEPMAIGMQISMVSTGAGDIVWSSNALFDAGDAEVVQDVHNFHDTHLAERTNLEGWRLILVSPSRFASYCCSRVVDTL